ncbi:MAG: hypothetical protein WBM46_00740 [Polyangiales bacterium]
MHPRLQRYIERALAHTEGIPEERKGLLEEVAAFVSSRREAGEVPALTFICTHNSRRSQMGQLWAAAAAAHFGVDRVRTFSAGTEVTAFHQGARAAMERAGFVIEHADGGNPRYQVSYAKGGPVVECFSKTYDDPANPTEGIAAIMTCSEADLACPAVSGAELRVSLPYDDPKNADGTPNEETAYDARCLQIATEMLYLFSRIS